MTNNNQENYIQQIEYKVFCQIKNITIRTFFRWKKEGKIKVVKQGRHSYVLVDIQDITMAIKEKNSHKKTTTKEDIKGKKAIKKELMKINSQVSSLINSLSVEDTNEQ